MGIGYYRENEEKWQRGNREMERSRLKQLRRKRLMLELAGILLLICVAFFAEYVEHPSLMGLCLAVMSLSRLALYFRFKNPYLLEVISRDVRELEEYEVNVLGKKRHPYGLTEVVLDIAVSVFVGYMVYRSLINESKYPIYKYEQGDYLFTLELFGAAMLVFLIIDWVRNRKLDRKQTEHQE